MKNPLISLKINLVAANVERACVLVLKWDAVQKVSNITKSKSFT